MARLRGSKPPGGRPPIPDQFRRFNPIDWIEPYRPPQGLLLAAVEDLWVSKAVDAYGRYKAARKAWAAEHGYSETE